MAKTKIETALNKFLSGINAQTVTKVEADWSSGELYFYETAVGRSTSGDLFKLGTTDVIVGNTGNDIDFKYYGSGSISAIIDCGDKTFTLAGIATSTNGTLTVSNTTEATTTSAAALMVAGGIANLKDCYFGDDIFLTSGAVLNWAAGNATITHSTSLLTINTPLTVTGTINSDNTTAATSTTTGSIQTDGGIGLAGALWVGTTSRLVGAATLDAGAVFSTTTTGAAFSGNYTNGILFTGQVVLTGANRNASYFGIGTYGAHITIDRSAQNESSRTYLMQAFADFAADTAATSDFAMVFYPRINITTANQTKSSYAVLSPTIDIDVNIKAGYALKAEMDASTAAFTAVTTNLAAVSGFLDLGAGTKNFDCSGTSGACAVRADFAGGAAVTLQGTSRTFALCANVYDAAVATGVMSVRVDGSGIVTDGICIELGATATMTNALAFNAVGGMTYFADFESVAGFLSADTGSPAGTTTHKIKINCGGTPGYIPVYADY